MHIHSSQFIQNWKKQNQIACFELYAEFGIDQNKIIKKFSQQSQSQRNEICNFCIRRFLIKNIGKQIKNLQNQFKYLKNEGLYKVYKILLQDYNPKTLKITEKIRREIVSYLKYKKYNQSLNVSQLKKIVHNYKIWKKQFLSGNISGGRSMRCFAWSEKQIKTLVHAYKNYGNKLASIRNYMVSRFQSRQKYDCSLIQSKLLTILKQSLQIVDRLLKDRGYTLDVSSSIITAKYFLCSNQEPEFGKVVKLLNLRENNIISQYQLLKMKSFILRFLGQQRLNRKEKRHIFSRITQKIQNKY